MNLVWETYAQFGMRGAAALGRMTHEGDEKRWDGFTSENSTLKILDLSRDQAKMFNYSKIYGPGMSILEAQRTRGKSVLPFASNFSHPATPAPSASSTVHARV